ncbi:MAG: DNA repair protein RecN [Chitinophagales bacterium]|nr:DNA repair protein RecN [Chitinophagales bacterium]
MLKRLHIRNYALIDELEINFSERLTIITGETGAGKSILLGALGLVMGERADNKVFYNEGEKCVVEAEFDIREYDLAEFFSDQELDYEQDLVIRRELSPAGKSRAFVNDTPVNNQVLQRLTESLIDLHQQFDTLDIHNVNFQLRMVDALADNAQRLRAYHDIYKVYSAAKRKLAGLIQRSEQGAKEMEFLLFQLGELEQAALVAGEDESMEAELERLSNAESIKQTYGAAYSYLQENEQNLIGQLQEIGRNMQTTRKFSPQLEAVSEQLQQTIAELQDIAKSCERISEQTEYDGQRIAEIQERLNVIYKLQKKHQVSSVAELLSIQEQLQKQTGGYSDLGAEIERLEQEIAAHEKTLRGQAAELAERRRQIAPDFESRVQEMLHQLSMPHARLKVDFQELSELNATGADEVQFLFATNVGSKFLPIKDVASGGELSRLTLCTKSLVADAIPLPTLIFDEIDTGISGDVSLRMGIILKELSDRHQVISITHTPQIAARADKHYFVYKKVDENRTITNIRLLTPDERVRSLAVMLSGNPPSDSAMATARELIG